ncbi:hypothetical protein GC163_17720 [bacterium]|nr:hypothetical protein [bacterium]
MQGWQSNSAFRSFFNQLLASQPYLAFRWETPGVTAVTLTRPFECVVLDAPTLERPADFSSFAEAFPTHHTDVAEFPNLGGDAILVVPAQQTAATAYGHLAAFVRHAPPSQQEALWQRVGEVLSRRIGTKPVWLSTAGDGVPWLHVRFDDRPKYYGYRAYRHYLR